VANSIALLILSRGHEDDRSDPRWKSRSESVFFTSSFTKYRANSLSVFRASPKCPVVPLHRLPARRFALRRFPPNRAGYVIFQSSVFTGSLPNLLELWVTSARRPQFETPSQYRSKARSFANLAIFGLCVYALTRLAGNQRSGPSTMDVLQHLLGRCVCSLPDRPPGSDHSVNVPVPRAISSMMRRAIPAGHFNRARNS